MKTIRKFFIAIATIAIGLAFTSCDDVKEGDRYIEGKPIEALRNVLLVDFTGQNCVNCPEAHVIIEQLEEQYGNNIIAVSVHCGGLAISTKRTNFEKGKVGLMTDEGQALMEAYGVEQWPMGTIDFGAAQTMDQWAGTVRTALDKPSDVTLNLTADYTPAENDGEEGYFGKINMKVEALCSSDRQARLQFWIIESGIVAEQRKLDGQTYNDYVHNNVFRGQVYDGLYGTDINLTDGMANTFEAEIDNRWTNKEHWNVNNLAVVAIISDKSGVIQCARVPLMSKTTD